MTPKGAWSGSRDLLLNFGISSVTYERIKVQTVRFFLYRLAISRMPRTQSSRPRSRTQIKPRTNIIESTTNQKYALRL